MLPTPERNQLNTVQAGAGKASSKQEYFTTNLRHLYRCYFYTNFQEVYLCQQQRNYHQAPGAARPTITQIIMVKGTMNLLQQIQKRMLNSWRPNSLWRKNSAGTCLQTLCGMQSMCTSKHLTRFYLPRPFRDTKKFRRMHLLI